MRQNNVERVKGRAARGRRPPRAEPGRPSESNLHHRQVHIAHAGNKRAATVPELRSSDGAAGAERAASALFPPVIRLNCSSDRKMCLQFLGHIHFLRPHSRTSVCTEQAADRLKRPGAVCSRSAAHTRTSERAINVLIIKLNRLNELVGFHGVRRTW